jgi:methylenetetrahydrofolate reductase (NADPH)
MKLLDKLNGQKITLSFEFFPPHTKSTSRDLFKTINNLIPLKPSYVSVTYGAGGSTRTLTNDLVLKIHGETSLTVVPHLTCTESTKNQVYSILKKYSDQGINNIMALRGDSPEQKSSRPGDFVYAKDLILFIKKEFPDFTIGVAGFPEGHPQTPNRLKEMDYLKEKVNSGADYICTQIFFDNHLFYDFQSRCSLEGINLPIIAGIMPITSKKTLYRMADLAGGTLFPSALLKLLRRAKNKMQFENAGIHWAAEQVRDLLDHNVCGIHFYTLNKYRRIKRIYESLGIDNSEQL